MAATHVLPRPKAYDDTFWKPISLWLTTTDHKLIGIMYMVTGILSFVIGGIFALIIRLQLSQPNLKVVDPWAMSIIVWAISGIMASTNFLTTIVALRAPGMKLTRLPLFVWAQISTSILLLVVGAPLAAAMILVEFGRQLGTQFFTTQGRPVLYQHLFWFFGHPEVYIMILPGFGMISEVIPVFARKPIFGYMSMVAALFGIVFLSMTVWAHHMFTVGMNVYVEGFFMLMTMLIAVPTGIKFFNWMATAWWGSIDFTVPVKFAFVLLATFLFGCITGV